MSNPTAYAFVEAIVVVRTSPLVLAPSLTKLLPQTPLGALSVVICAITSSIFLKEKLSFFGWLGCGLCIVSCRFPSLVFDQPTKPAWICNYST